MFRRLTRAQRQHPVLTLPRPTRKTIDLGEMFESPNDLPDTSLERLLGAILYQAQADSMSAVEFDYQPDLAKLCMRYYGIVGTPDARWWEMTPPLPQWYGRIFKLIVLLTSFKTLDPLSGTIQILSGRKREDIEIHYKSIYRIRMVWPSVDSELLGD